MSIGKFKKMKKILEEEKWENLEEEEFSTSHPYSVKNFPVRIF